MRKSFETYWSATAFLLAHVIREDKLPSKSYRERNVSPTSEHMSPVRKLFRPF
jgi:hypothetical protein